MNKDFVVDTGAVVIHPYNDEHVIAGQGTVAVEFLEDYPDLDVITNKEEQGWESLKHFILKMR